MLRNLCLFRHSASRIGHRLFVFGGWDYPVFFDDLFVLDLGKALNLTQADDLCTKVHTL